jgi:DnaJ family protein C protein 28
MQRLSIDEIIRQAMEEGKFDDLPGKGKPLNLNQSPHEDPDWRVAHHMLRSAGFSLPWIERLKEIQIEIDQARQVLQQAWSWQRQQSQEQLGETPQVDWGAAKAGFKEKVKGINLQIRNYNLEVPYTRFQILLLDADQEVERITKT